MVVSLLATYGASTLYLHDAYNNVFRRRMGYNKFCSVSGMVVESKIDHFDARIRRLVYDFYQRLVCSENSLFTCVMINLVFRFQLFMSPKRSCKHVLKFFVDFNSSYLKPQRVLMYLWLTQTTVGFYILFFIFMYLGRLQWQLSLSYIIY